KNEGGTVFAEAGFVAICRFLCPALRLGYLPYVAVGTGPGVLGSSGTGSVIPRTISRLTDTVFTGSQCRVIGGINTCILRSPGGPRRVGCNRRGIKNPGAFFHGIGGVQPDLGRAAHGIFSGQVLVVCGWGSKHPTVTQCLTGADTGREISQRTGNNRCLPVITITAQV